MVNSMRRSKHKSGVGGGRTKTQHSYLNSLLRVLPNTQQLLSRKYYQPIVSEEERRLAELITYHQRGLPHDPMGLKQAIAISTPQEHLTSYHPDSTLLEVICSRGSESKPRSAVGAAFRIVKDGHKRRQAYHTKMHFLKKESSKSTAISSKKSSPVLKAMHGSPMNESKELNRLTKCLKGALNKYDSKKGYKVFVSEMEKKGMEPQEQSEGMMKLILNLERDFSSIHQTQEKDFSKEMIYGLSDLKKQSDKSTGGRQKGEGRHSGQGLLLKRIDFGRRNRQNEQSRGLSTSKNSKKSVSGRGKKNPGLSNTNSATPDARPGSKSRSKKKLVLKMPDKSTRAVDTQKLYFDAQAPVSRVEEKADAGKAMVLADGVKPRRKVVKR